MNRLSFKSLYYCITEDIDKEIQNLQQQISNLEAQKFSRTKPIDDAISRLKTMLAQKQRQKGTTQQNNAQRPTTTTTTPGSSGSQTPGVK
jgi:hypothetical protein